PRESNQCPKCGCDDSSMLEHVDDRRWFCNNCSHDWMTAISRGRAFDTLRLDPSFVEGRESTRRFVSLDDLVARTGLRRDEVVTLADIGALNGFGYDRRSALWQAERAVRPSGELFDETGEAGWAGEAGTAGKAGWENSVSENSVFSLPAFP